MNVSRLIKSVILLLLTTSIFAQSKDLGFGLRMFNNIEQTVYCVPLPLNEIKELPANQRASHSFVHKKNKNYTITISGYYVSDEKITLDSLYKKQNSAELEEEGKIITQNRLFKSKDCFYSIGYYNNFLGKMEFLEITWLRGDELIKLEINYPVKEKEIWKNRLKVIIDNAYCK